MFFACAALLIKAMTSQRKTKVQCSFNTETQLTEGATAAAKASSTHSLVKSNADLGQGEGQEGQDWMPVRVPFLFLAKNTLETSWTTYSN